MALANRTHNRLQEAARVTTPVQLLAALPEQAFVSGVAHERMLEDVGDSRRSAATEDQLCSGQAIRCDYGTAMYHSFDLLNLSQLDMETDHSPNIYGLVYQER